MGAKFAFRCPGCGYAAEVSGGHDIGMLAVVKTSVCLDCRGLVDVLIGTRGQDGPTGNPDFDRYLGRCPQCDGLNVSPWSKGNSCPKCESIMTRGEMTILWD